MTLYELYEELGERIVIIKKEDLTEEQRAIENAQTALINMTANNMIKIADVTLRAEKLAAENKSLRESRIMQILG